MKFSTISLITFPIAVEDKDNTVPIIKDV
jgi:hypothetical protein